MMSSILFQMHVMWYESEIVMETLDSLEVAIEHCDMPVDILICLNLQTYIEKPINPISLKDFTFLHHPVLNDAGITIKTDTDPFYNIADWRRDIYYDTYKYTIWGESDCLVPYDYLWALSQLQFDVPHVVSLASRKMGDDSWGEVEFVGMEKYVRSWPERNDSIPFPMFAHDTITYDQMCEVNDTQDDLIILPVSRQKIDGALLALSPNIPKFIPDDMHFAREDYCANLSFIKNNIPQYVIKNRMKGHNYRHPLKRVNTNNTRDEEVYKMYEQESYEAMVRFINKTGT